MVSTAHAEGFLDALYKNDTPFLPENFGVITDPNSGKPISEPLLVPSNISITNEIKRVPEGTWTPQTWECVGTNFGGTLAEGETPYRGQVKDISGSWATLWCKDDQNGGTEGRLVKKYYQNYTSTIDENGNYSYRCWLEGKRIVSRVLETCVNGAKKLQRIERYVTTYVNGYATHRAMELDEYTFTKSGDAERRDFIRQSYNYSYSPNSETYAQNGDTQIFKRFAFKKYELCNPNIGGNLNECKQNGGETACKKIFPHQQWKYSGAFKTPGAMHPEPEINFDYNFILWRTYNDSCNKVISQLPVGNKWIAPGIDVHDWFHTLGYSLSIIGDDPTWQYKFRAPHASEIPETPLWDSCPDC